MRAPDDGPVGAGDRAVPVQVFELDPAGARAVVPERGRIQRVSIVAVRHQAVKRPDRLADRSEEHTSELQSLAYLVCRLLLEKKKKKEKYNTRSQLTHTCTHRPVS